MYTLEMKRKRVGDADVLAVDEDLRSGVPPADRPEISRRGRHFFERDAALAQELLGARAVPTAGLGEDQHVARPAELRGEVPQHGVGIAHIVRIALDLGLD